MIEMAEQLGQHIGLVAACDWLGVPRSSLYRARQPKLPAQPRPASARALSAEERTEVRQVLNSDRFQDSSPRQIYAELLDDEELYLCHWRTMYRILADHQEVGDRRNQLHRPPAVKPVLVATAPKQVWSWDMTELRGSSPGISYYLYVIIFTFR